MVVLVSGKRLCIAPNYASMRTNGLRLLVLMIEGQEGHNRKEVVNLFVIADHDFLDETWIRLA